MIKTGGANVAPLEVEHVLLQHPDIVQAHVVGVPDRLKGEMVAAAVEGDVARRRRRRGDHRLGLRAAGELQGADTVRLSRGGRVPAHIDRQDPQAGPAPGTGVRRHVIGEERMPGL